jgi:hypothetical protein
MMRQFSLRIARMITRSCRVFGCRLAWLFKDLALFESYVIVSDQKEENYVSPDLVPTYRSSRGSDC